MEGSIWSLFGYEEKDLSDIPNATKDYRCPNCGSYPEAVTEDDETYEVDGEEYPQFYNEYLHSDMDGTIHDWDEVHCCPKCKTKYQFRNGCF